MNLHQTYNKVWWCLGGGWEIWVKEWGIRMRMRVRYLLHFKETKDFLYRQFCSSRVPRLLTVGFTIMFRRPCYTRMFVIKTLRTIVKFNFVPTVGFWCIYLSYSRETNATTVKLKHKNMQRWKHFHFFSFSFMIHIYKRMVSFSYSVCKRYSGYMHM